MEYGSVSPDGQSLVYDSNVAGNQDIFRTPLTGGDPEQGADSLGAVMFGVVVLVVLALALLVAPALAAAFPLPDSLRQAIERQIDIVLGGI